MEPDPPHLRCCGAVKRSPSGGARGRGHPARLWLSPRRKHDRPPARLAVPKHQAQFAPFQVVGCGEDDDVVLSRGHPGRVPVTAPRPVPNAAHRDHGGRRRTVFVAHAQLESRGAPPERHIGSITDPQFLALLEHVGRRALSSFPAHDLLVLDHLHREDKVPPELRSRLPRLIRLGVVESVGRGRGTRYLLSRKAHAALGSSGTYTRQLGLDRAQNKALLLKHTEESAEAGAKFEEFQQALPGLSRDQVQTLVRELKRERLVVSRGATKAARWFPAPKTQSDAVPPNREEEEQAPIPRVSRELRRRKDCVETRRSRAPPCAEGSLRPVTSAGPPRCQGQEQRTVMKRVPLGEPNPFPPGRSRAGSERWPAGSRHSERRSYLAFRTRLARGTVPRPVRSRTREEHTGPRDSAA